MGWKWNTTKHHSKEEVLRHKEASLAARIESLEVEGAALAERKQALSDKAAALEAEVKELGRRQKELHQQETALAERIAVVEGHSTQLKEKLARVGHMDADALRSELTQALQSEVEAHASSAALKVVEAARAKADMSAKKIVLEAIQRIASEAAIESSTCTIRLEGDHMKGKVIGREGRNIRAFEAATGVDVLIDDTPDVIALSCFDPVRRNVAALALNNLLKDGRIHPSRIEEVVDKAQKDVHQTISEAGEKAVIELGIQGMHGSLVELVGRMHYRSSYGQNLLHHSREVARLCETMAAELGLDAELAKRAGLLHDIGKVYPDKTEKPHALLGCDLAKKYHELPDVCNAIGAHHDEIEMNSLLAPVVQACDAISGARPGARKEMLESYIKRLATLEKMAMNFKGVTQCYAIQAGRELRVMVDSTKTSDQDADLLALNISRQIEREMNYPGQVKVTVIREKRASAIAK